MIYNTITVFNTKISHIGALILFFLVCLPVVDNLSGIRSFPIPNISLIFRVLLLILFTYLSLKNNYQAPLLILGFFLVLSISLFNNLISLQDNTTITEGFNYIIKTYYTFVTYFGLLYLINNNLIQRQMLLKAMTISIFIYLIFIYIGVFVDFGRNAYGGGFGSTGFMIAGNDLSLSIAISGPVILEYFKSIKSKFIYIYVTFYILGLLLTFTKSGFLGIAFILFIFFRQSSRVAKRITLFLLVLLLAFIYISIIYELNNIIYDIYILYSNLIKNFGLIGFFFRGRDKVFNVLGNIAGELRPYNILFGFGFEEYSSVYGKYTNLSINTLPYAEMDIFDIFFIYGIIGALVIYIFYLKKSIECIKEKQKIWYSLFIFWIHSIFAGHAIMTPIVGTNIAIIFILYSRRLKNNENSNNN